MLHKSWEPSTALKVSVFGVFLVHTQSECGKIWTRKTPNTDSFYVVIIATQNPKKLIKQNHAKHYNLCKSSR